MRMFLLFVFLLGTAFGLPQAADKPGPHGIEFWRSIAKDKYSVPAGESGDSLARELSKALASPNPELRDELAYGIYARWIGRPGTLSQQTLEALTDEWRANLKGADSVLHRSFSALSLVFMAQRDAKAPFLGEARYHQLVSDALRYLRDEKDLRGYDAKVGWIHATAHTADLLEALVLNSKITKEEESSILAGVAHRLATAPQVYSQGEQDRLAAAVNTVIRRPDFDASLFDTWLGDLQKADTAVWAKPLTPESLAMFQNHTYMLQGLAVRLSLGDETPAVVNFKTKVLAILKTR